MIAVTLLACEKLIATKMGTDGEGFTLLEVESRTVALSQR